MWDAFSRTVSDDPDSALNDGPREHTFGFVAICMDSKVGVLEIDRMIPVKKRVIAN